MSFKKFFKLHPGSWAGWFSSADTELVACLDKLDYMGVAQALTDGSTIAWDTALGAFATVTLGGNRTLGLPTNLKKGCLYGIALTQDGTGSRLLTWNGVFAWGDYTATLSTAPAAVDRYTFFYDGSKLNYIAGGAVEVSALANVSAAANKLPYFTGSTSADVTDLTAAGRALLDDANAAAQLTTLGVSAAAQTILDDASVAAIVTTLKAQPGFLDSTIKQQTKTTGTLAEADVGQVNWVAVDAQTLTLPATVAGMTFIIANSGADGAAGITVSPNASDKIMGAGLTSADDKDLVNTKATAKNHDFIVLVGDGVNGWYVTGMKGTWARET